MPHFVANNLNDLQYPASYEDIKYNFEISSKYDTLISVSIEGQDFFLTKCKNAKMQTIVKTEKYTRIPQVSLIQKAIKGYMQLSKADVISQNVCIQYKQQKKSFLYGIRDSTYFTYFFQKEYVNKNIYLEIGFGSGRHILDKAINNKNDIFIGLELHTPSIEQVSKLAFTQNIQNLHLGKFDARIFLEMLPSNSLKAIYVHFPVPWDKKPHRRIYSDSFLDTAQRVLKQNGTLELRTDSDNYYEYVKKLFKDNNKEIKIRENKSIATISKYEDRWQKQNKNIYDITFTNKEISENIDTKFNFTFPHIEDVLKNINNIPHIINKYDDYFIHFKNIYTKEDLMLIKISFGHFNQVENNYLLIKQNAHISYLSKPIFSKYNIKAHNKILQLLNDEKC